MTVDHLVPPSSSDCWSWVGCRDGRKCWSSGRYLHNLFEDHFKWSCTLHTVIAWELHWWCHSALVIITVVDKERTTFTDLLLRGIERYNQVQNNSNEIQPKLLLPRGGQIFPRKVPKKVQDLLSRDPTLTRLVRKVLEVHLLDWRRREQSVLSLT